MINKYPIGLLARSEYFRVLKSVWTQEVKDFVLSRMIASSGNIKPVIVIDDITKECICYFPNINFTAFDLLSDPVLCRQVETVAEWHIEKYKLQKSTKTEKEKDDLIKLIEKKYLRKEKLTSLEEKNLLNDLEKSK